MSYRPDLAGQWQLSAQGTKEQFAFEYDLINGDVVVATNMCVQLTRGLDKAYIQANVGEGIRSGTLMVREDMRDPDSPVHKMTFPSDRIDESAITVNYCPVDGYFYARFPHTEADIEAQRQANRPDFGNAYTA